MRKIIYYVAASLDGYISGPQEDISGFLQKGEGVEKYLKDLQEFDTVIMGRNTYEFGYKWGILPGQPAYPHMKHYIFSDFLQFDNPSALVKVCPLDITFIEDLKQEQGTAIYLAGGGAFAGWLLDHRAIDVLKIKLNPLVLGKGVRLFGSSEAGVQLVLDAAETFSDGMSLLNYSVRYP